MKHRVVSAAIVALFSACLSLAPAGARPRGSVGVAHNSTLYYGGGHHTAGHGGHYVGGIGSSHRWGQYINPRTGNHYGRHK